MKKRSNVKEETWLIIANVLTTDKKSEKYPLLSTPHVHDDDIYNRDGRGSIFSWGGAARWVSPIYDINAPVNQGMISNNLV